MEAEKFGGENFVSCLRVIRNNADNVPLKPLDNKATKCVESRRNRGKEASKH